MTAQRRRNLSLDLDAQDAGTLLGVLAWVLGALEIMKDRGHAEKDEQFRELYGSLTPRLNALVAQIAGARRAIGDDAEMERQLEEAYAPVRAAFEAWIQLTALDTFSAAVGQRLDGLGDDEGDGEGDGADAERAEGGG